MSVIGPADRRGPSGAQAVAATQTPLAAVSAATTAIAAMYEVPFLAVRESRAIHLGDRDAVRDLARTTVPSPTEEAAILVTA